MDSVMDLRSLKCDGEIVTGQLGAMINAKPVSEGSVEWSWQLG